MSIPRFSVQSLEPLAGKFARYSPISAIKENSQVQNEPCAWVLKAVFCALTLSLCCAAGGHSDR